MTAELNQHRKQPPHLRLRHYALSDLGRDHRLNPTDRYVLLELAQRADWRSWTWRGSLTDLAVLSGLTRRTISNAVTRLASKKVITIVEPFRQWGQGVVFIECYGKLDVAAPEPKPYRADLADRYHADLANTIAPPIAPPIAPTWPPLSDVTRENAHNSATREARSGVRDESKAGSSLDEREDERVSESDLVVLDMKVEAADGYRRGEYLMSTGAPREERTTPEEVDRCLDCHSTDHATGSPECELPL